MKQAFRVSLTGRNADEIAGTIDTNNCDPDFTMECLTLVLERWSEASQVPMKEILEDIWAIHVRGKLNG